MTAAPCYVSQCSTTAARAFGNYRYVGAPRRVSIDNQAELVRAVMVERARRALWADCERRPLEFDLPQAASCARPGPAAQPAPAMVSEADHRNRRTS